MRLDPAHSPASVLFAMATALVTLAFAFGLWNHGPIPAMETRFAVAVQQMLAHHQWLIPEKNGLPYIEYPPFYYWMALVLAKMGLPTLPAIRLPNLLALWVWLGALYALTRQLLPTLPRWLLPVTALIAPAVLYNFFIAQSDAWLGVGVMLALLGYLRHSQRTGFPWLLWSGTALAVFAKGPVGLVLVALAVGLDLALAAMTGVTRWRELPHRVWRLALVRGVLLALTPLAAWYLACGFSVGWDFVRAALVYDNFTRFVTGAGGHANPWWLYAQSFWTDYLPWSVVVPFGLIIAAWRVRERGPRLALAWAVTTVVFFSLSASKQSKYILPAAPAFAALALLALSTLTRRRPAWLARGTAAWAAFVLLVFVILVGTWLPQVGPHIDDDATYAQLRGMVAAAPGRLFMYRWPRSLILWQLGAPMPWFRDARAVYTAVHDGRLRPGDYLLVYRDNLLQRGSYALQPPPKAPYFARVMMLRSKGGIVVFRVLPGAAGAPLPATPKPPATPWWSRFDTD
jgi:4-amino-4-deoxy-L-arabinose transferase-like glycosyltransferase